MKRCGIYKITNIVTGQFYIGSSIQYEARILQHIASFKRNDHYNTELQIAWNDYGPDIFTFELIEECLPDHIKELEGKYLLEYVGTPNCYNISKDPLSPTRGTKRPPEVIDSIRKANSGQKRTAEQIEANRQAQIRKNQERKLLGIPHPNSGKKRSTEFKEKCRKRQTGKPLSEKAKETLLRYAKMPKTDEHRRKISESEKNTKGKKQPDKTSCS